MARSFLDGQIDTGGVSEGYREHPTGRGINSNVLSVQLTELSPLLTIHNFFSLLTVLFNMPSKQAFETKDGAVFTDSQGETTSIDVLTRRAPAD